MIKQLPTEISNMTKNAVVRLQEGCGGKRTSRDAIDNVYTKRDVIDGIIEVWWLIVLVGQVLFVMCHE